jgi:hypothetical protein
MLLGRRPCGPVVRSSLRREPDVPGDLLRARFGNLTKPSAGKIRPGRRDRALCQISRSSLSWQGAQPEISSGPSVVHMRAARRLAAKKIRHVRLGFQQELRDLVLKRETLFLQCFKRRVVGRLDIGLHSVNGAIEVMISVSDPSEMRVRAFQRLMVSILSGNSSCNSCAT